MEVILDEWYYELLIEKVGWIQSSPQIGINKNVLYIYFNKPDYMNKKIRELIDKAKENKASRLSFDAILEKYDDIDEIPEDIFEIESIKELSLGRMPIKEVSSKISLMKNLTVFSSQSSFLKTFPLELLECTSLREVSLGLGLMTNLPEQLNRCENITYLNLTNCVLLNEVNGIPPKLHYLNLSNTGFQQLPLCIYTLNLTKLVICNLQLDRLPDAICGMTSLYSLFVGDNNLTELPNKIANLHNLQELWIDGNEYKVLPEVLTKMPSLCKINASNNFLNDLPSSIINLSQLNDISLGNNNFDKIPQILFSLKNLTSISFANYSNKKNNQVNQIKEVPIDILSLVKLTKLDLFKNDINNIPEEILDNGFAAIKNFLESQKEADDEEYLYEAKMVVVGRGNVGKTVLRKKLTEPDYSLVKSVSTTGIEILKKPFIFKMSGLDKSEGFRFNIWDFGGQEKYDATHQLFITNRSIYLFLTEAREESNYLDFYHWLNTINLFGGNAPVIVVLSKCDERSKHLPESIYRERFNNIVDFVDVSCADGYEHTIVGLNKIIERAILLLPQTKQQLSNRWVNVRNALEELSETKDYISYEEYLEVCKQNKLDQKRADFLSQYLNDLGVIIHHQYDLLLKKTVFIKTDWCVDGMYRVLDDTNVINGKFTINDLSTIWSDERFRDKQAELLKLMHEYNLCFELKDGSGYIAPELLPHDKPTDFEWNSDNNLQFEIRYDFMPVGILSRFIVKSHSFIKDDFYWKFGVILKHENTEALVQEDYINSKIKVALKGENKKGLLTAIRMFIEEVHKDFDKANKLVFEEMVPCNCLECLTSKIPHFYKFNVLRKYEQKSKPTISCEESLYDVKIDSLINDVQINAVGQYILTNQDLKSYILSVIETHLEKEISMKDGYIPFWRDQKCTVPKNEIEFQPYISNVIDNNCKLQGIQLSREVHEANGSVDILFSYTNMNQEILKVCLEIKKAHHADVTTAISTQLPLYMESAGTDSGIYLIIWLKNKSFTEPQKYSTENILAQAIANNNTHRVSIKMINACKKTSPSKKRK